MRTHVRPALHCPSYPSTSLSSYFPYHTCLQWPHCVAASVSCLGQRGQRLEKTYFDLVAELRFRPPRPLSTSRTSVSRRAHRLAVP